MNYKAIVFLLGLLSFSNCNKSDIDYSFIHRKIKKSSNYAILPKGIEKNNFVNYEEGFCQYFTYADKSYILILKGGNATLKLPESNPNKTYSRKERINQTQIGYVNVPENRKAEFDKAFDLMKENGFSKK